MAIKIMTMVWEAEFPNIASKMVALKLADCANDDGENIYPSVGTVERATGCSASTIRKWMFAMEHCGLLEVVERSGGGTRKDTTIRRFNLAALESLRKPRDGQPKQVLTETKRIHAGTGKGGKDVEVTVFDIGPPLRPADPSAECTPPPGGPHPSARRTPTPPPGGPNPSVEPSGEPSSPLPGSPGGGQLIVANPEPKPSKNKTTLPEDFELPDEWREWARSEAPRFEAMIDHEGRKFADWAHGNGARKKDWRATWRNWWRTAVERAPRTFGIIPDARERKAAGARDFQRLIDESAQGGLL